MWVSQTYLGVVEPDADVFVYYLFLNYIPEQAAFTERLQRELEGLGDVFGGKVSLLMPNPRYAGKIEAEVREIRPLWEAVYSKLPGLLVSTVPMSHITDYEDTCLFVPFEPLNILGLSMATNKIKTLADRTIAWTHKPVPADPSTFTQRVVDALELKPGVFGFRIDLRKLFRR
jgi:hypothetical protein